MCIFFLFNLQIKILHKSKWFVCSFVLLLLRTIVTGICSKVRIKAFRILMTYSNVKNRSKFRFYSVGAVLQNGQKTRKMHKSMKKKKRTSNDFPFRWLRVIRYSPFIMATAIKLTTMMKTTKKNTNLAKEKFYDFVLSIDHIGCSLITNGSMSLISSK